MKEIIIDLKNVSNVSDVIYRFYKSINCFYYLSEQEMLENVKNNSNVNWGAFSDNISGVEIEQDGKEVMNLLLKVVNISDFRKLSVESFDIFLEVLAQRSDIKQRVDGKNVYLQFSLGD